MTLPSDDHHFGRLDQRVNGDSSFQSEASCGVACNYRGDLLVANVDGHLHEQTFKANVSDRAQKFVSATDRIQAHRLSAFRSLRFGASNALNFASRYSVMSAGGFGRTNLARIDPLLQSWVTNSGQARSVEWFQKVAHDRLAFTLLSQYSFASKVDFGGNEFRVQFV